MKQKLIIFGTGKISDAISYFFNRDSSYEIGAYVVDDAFANLNTFLDKQVIPLSKVTTQFPADNFHVFVAMGYQGMNGIRRSKYEFFKDHGYSFASYTSPLVSGNFTLGENSIVMDGAIIQPHVNFGNNVFVWGGCMVGHHAIINDHCWLTGGCQIGGISNIGNHTFLGLGAIVGNEVTIGSKCMLGAGSLTSRSLEANSVLVTPNTEIHRLNSDQFTRMSTCFRT